MEQNYTIAEILLAVDEIQNSKKKKKNIRLDNQANNNLNQNLSIPKSTLRLIEEAEKNKN